jgi:hypothetical protein
MILLSPCRSCDSKRSGIPGGKNPLNKESRNTGRIRLFPGAFFVDDCASVDSLELL